MNVSLTGCVTDGDVVCLISGCYSIQGGGVLHLYWSAASLSWNTDFKAVVVFFFPLSFLMDYHFA